MYFVLKLSLWILIVHGTALHKVAFSYKYIICTEYIILHLFFLSPLLTPPIFPLFPPDCFSSREIFTLTHTFHRMQSTVRWRESLWWSLGSGRTSRQQECAGQQGFSPSKKPTAPELAPMAGHHYPKSKALWYKNANSFGKRVFESLERFPAQNQLPKEVFPRCSHQIHRGHCSCVSGPRAAGYVTSWQKGLVVVSMWCWLYTHTKLQSGRVTETFTRIAGRCRGQAMRNRVRFSTRRPETMKWGCKDETCVVMETSEYCRCQECGLSIEQSCRRDSEF